MWQGGTAEGLVLPSFVEHLISLYVWEEYTVNHDLESDLKVRMYDSGSQSLDQVNTIARYVHEVSKLGTTLTVCQAGLNRSSVVVARALMYDGYSADDSIKLIRDKRSEVCLCNNHFVSWLREQDENGRATRE